jgi:DNA polymerase elongation subunit (family B)
MSLNISPETKIGVVQNWNEERLLNNEPFDVKVSDGNTTLDVKDFKRWLQQTNSTVASNGAIYSTKKKGFLPAILEKWFDERVKFKNQRDEYEVGSEQYKFYDAMQLTQKVLLNSFYGVLGLKTFRFHDLDNAGAITATGQSVIKFSAKVINKYYEKEITTANDEYELEFEDGSIQTYKGTDLIELESGQLIPLYMVNDINNIKYPYNILVSV